MIGARRLPADRSRSLAILVVLTLVVVACGSVARVADPDRRAHDQTVRDLEAQVDAEDGWVVVTLPNLHEGGGTSTWWLAPCDPDVDDRRRATVTAFHGSDVMGLPGRFDVAERETPCVPPSRQVHHGDRVLTLDVTAVPLAGSVALLDPRDHVVVEDADGATYDVRRDAGTATACLDGARWDARLDSERELRADVISCTGTLAALPTEVTGLLRVVDGTEQVADHRPGVDDDEVARAFEAAGWAADDDAVRTAEGALFTAAWYGPCHPDVVDDDVTASRTVASQLGGLVALDREPCDR